ncbi:hypothetical protein Dsin_020374 [Dipteronia sinensis]|uniref:non-specific serine/threonine protein kinase n=1 Tax=Dipteronia sinensis TaxID=43782 RepID=A0AAE0AAB8_9ROSI|nr:hypothetical protein Dsin_020374 [Dipteronia sinensis]
MAAALRSFYFCIVFSAYCFSFALAEDDSQFIYNGFAKAELQLFGAFVHDNGLLQLTNTSMQYIGHAFYRFPIKFNTSSSQSLSFSTNFVFAMVPRSGYYGGHGIAFFISPSTKFSGTVTAGSYLGRFNISNHGLPTNHILVAELDTVEHTEFQDIDEDHVGIDVNSQISVDSAPSAYFSDEDKKNKSLALESGNPLKMWIEYNGEEKLLNVTLAPIGIPKPSRPLLATSIDLSQILLDSMYVGFSAATGSDHYILGWSFNKTGQAQNLNIKDLPSLPKPGDNTKHSVKPSLPFIVLIVAAVVVLTTIGGAVYVVRKKKYEEIYEDWEREYGPQRFSYKSLYKATGGFKDTEIIGKGGFGKVYKGVLPNSNLQIAVKRISHDSKQGLKEFVAEIVSIGRLRHRNLVQLRGYCRRKGELLLVYDYMPNGSLDKILYGSMRPNLNWFQRIRIVRGVACGLLYLHEEWEQVVLHRDIKPANVLLDADLNGKLGDFGLARLYDRGSNPQTTNLVGTIGYLAPELLKTGKATTSSDVFSFGAFMLEVACGRRPMEPGEIDLVDRVIECWKKGSILDAGDPRLEGIFAEEQMELILKLGLVCSHPNPAIRPSMRQVMQYLDGDAKFPDISPDSNVIGAFTETNEASNTMATFSSLFESSSSHTMSTIDSIIISGR